MELKPRMGAPITITQEIIDRVVEAVGVAFRPETVANLSRVHPNNLRRWLKQGSEDAELGISSPYAHLWWNFNQKKAEKVVQWLGDIEQRLPNWQATWELVRATAKEDFGIESVEYKDLLDLYNNLVESYKRFTENPIQGVLSNGREMDIKGD